MTEKRRNMCIAIMTVMIVGLFTHIFVMTNKMINYNEMNMIFISPSHPAVGSIGEGRWMLSLLFLIPGTRYSVPAITGMIGIVMIALSAAMIVDLLQIRDRIKIVLFSTAMIVFPASACFMSYCYLGQFWFFGVFLAVLSVWLTGKSYLGQIVGIICVALCTAIHQSMITFTVAVAFCCLFNLLLNEKDKMNIKSFWRWVGKFALLLIGGLVLYLVLTKMIISISGVKLTDYRGISEMTTFTVRGVVKGFVYCYVYFFLYFFTTTYHLTLLTVILNVILLLSATVLYIRRVSRFAKNGEKGRFILTILMTLALPLGMVSMPAFMMYRVGGGVDRYAMYSLVMTVALLMILWKDEYKKEQDQVLRTTGVIITVGILLSCVGNYLMVNRAYARFDAVQNQTDAYMNRMVMRIEEQNNWTSDIPVYFSMEKDFFTDYYEVDIDSVYSPLPLLQGVEYSSHYSPKAMAGYMNVMLHFPVTHLADEDRIQKLEATAEYQAMGIYPAKDSMKMIDGVLVVRMKE